MQKMNQPLPIASAATNDDDRSNARRVSSSTSSFALESEAFETSSLPHLSPVGSSVKACRQIGMARSEIPFSPYSLARGGSARNNSGDTNASTQYGSQMGSTRVSRHSSRSSLLHTAQQHLPTKISSLGGSSVRLSTDFSPYVLWGRNKSPATFQQQGTSGDNNHHNQIHQQGDLNGSNSINHGLTMSSHVGSPTTPRPALIFSSKQDEGGISLLTAQSTLTQSADTMVGEDSSAPGLTGPVDDAEPADTFQEDTTEPDDVLDNTITPSSTNTPTAHTVPPTPSKFNVLDSPRDSTFARPIMVRSTSGLQYGEGCDATASTSEGEGVADGSVETRSRGPSMLQVDSSQGSPAISRKGTATIGFRQGGMNQFATNKESMADFDVLWGVSRQVSYANRTTSMFVDERQACELKSGAQLEDDGVGNCMIDDYLMSEEPFKKTRHSEVYLADDTKQIMDTATSSKRAIKRIRLPLVESTSNTISRTTSQQQHGEEIPSNSAKEMPEKDLQRLGREISIWKGLSNRYIVPLYKVLVSSDKRDAYLVMEYMEGGTLLSVSKAALGDDSSSNSNSSDDDDDGDVSTSSSSPQPAAAAKTPSLPRQLLPPKFTPKERKELCRSGVRQYNPLPIADIKRYIEQLSGALTYLHGKGITHYDVKPENVLLCTGQGGRTEVRLTDFGTSELQSDKSSTSNVENVSFVSHTGSRSESPEIISENAAFDGGGAATRMASMGFRKNFLKGTHKFLAPEAFIPVRDGAPHADTRPLDMWALGITLYAMCTGHFPFRGTNVNDIRDAATHDTPYYPPSMDKALVYLCVRLLRKDPSQRWTAPKLYAALHKRRMDGALLGKKGRRESAMVPSIAASSVTAATSSSTTTTSSTPAHKTGSILAAAASATLSSTDVPVSFGSPRKHLQIMTARAMAAADPQNQASAPVSRQSSEGGMLRFRRTQSHHSSTTDHTNLDAREVESLCSVPCQTHRSNYGDPLTPGGVPDRRCSTSSGVITDREEDFEINDIPTQNNSPENTPPFMAAPNNVHPVEEEEEEGSPTTITTEEEEGDNSNAAMQSSSNSEYSDNLLNVEMSFDAGTSFAFSKEQQLWVMEQVLKGTRREEGGADKRSKEFEDF